MLDDILKRQLFDEITEHLLTDIKPSEYLNVLSDKEVFKQYPLGMLNQLKSTEQSKKYHPEGNVWNHTMLVLDEAAKVRGECSDAKAFMWAALLHDIGKPDTTRMKNERITSYDHDIAGEKLCIKFLRAFMKEDEAFIQKVSSLVRYHMHILYLLKNLPYKDMAGLLKRVNIGEIALLCRCDRRGRTGVDLQTEDTEYREFLSRLKQMVVEKS